MAETITINKDELFDLIRKAVRIELDNVQYISNEEQEEIDTLYKDSLNNDNYDPKNCVRL